MNIFFHTPISSVDKLKSNFKLIRRTILTLGNQLTYDWYESIFEKRVPTKTTKFLEKTLDFIKESDLTICESTALSFESGFLIDMSIKLKKPTLILIEKDADLAPSAEEYLEKLPSDYVTVQKYYAQELESIISKFINDNRSEPTSRFNFMIERKQRDYLDWADRFYKQSKTDIIKQLLNHQIQNDQNYQRLLNNVTKKF